MFSNKLIFVFIVAFAVDCLCKPPKSSNADCKPNKMKWRDYTYKPEIGDFIKFHTTPRSWLRANQICELEDAILMYPQNENEADIMWDWGFDVLEDTRPRPDPFVHIGITDLNSTSNGKFLTVDGIPVENVYHDWAYEEPNNRNGIEHCGQMYFDKTLNDAKCNGTEDEEGSEKVYLPYICRKKLSVKNIGSSYHHNSDLGSCYSLQLGPLNWTQAEDACTADHAHLAIIETQAEADYLVKLVADAASQVTGDFNRNIVHLGFHNRRGIHWETVTNIGLASNKYVKWANKEHDMQRKGKCGSMHLDGKLIDSNCSDQAIYICERE